MNMSYVPHTITVNISMLRPSTLAAMIADLLGEPASDLRTIKALLAQLEMTVGEEESIEYLVDAGVTPEELIEMWDLVAAMLPEATIS